MESIIQSEKRCIVCHATAGLHRHHVFYGHFRSVSEKQGMTVWLCGKHHNMSNEGVHFNKRLDIQIKQLGQSVFEETHSREEFVALFGKNYL